MTVANRLPILILCLGAGCAPFQQEVAESRPGAESRPAVEAGETALTTGNLAKKQTVDVRGRFEAGEFHATKIQIQADDDEVSFKAALDHLEAAAARGSAGGVEFRLDDESRLVDAKGEKLSPGDFKAGDWVKVETTERDGELFVRKLTRRTRGAAESETLQGPIERVDLKRNRILLAGGVVVWLEPEPLVVWDQETPPPEIVVQEKREAVLRTFSSGIPTIRRDEEEERPADQLTIGQLLRVGGEVKHEFEYRDNFDLEDDRDRDRLVSEASAKLEISADIARNVFAFGEVRTRYEAVIFDEDADLELGESTELAELYVLLEDLPVRGVAFQVGRQDFDHGREWVMDEQYDAARLYFNLDPSLLELSVGQKLTDTTVEEDDITNLFAALHTTPFEEHDLFLYAMHRRGGSLIDLDRTHVGFSASAEIGDFEWWVDGSAVFGSEDAESVAGFGFDIAAMYVVQHVPLEPSIFAGFAFGSGDDDPADGNDHNFRQTGLHDNNDRFNGVVSFRYLGELTRFELSNLIVTTLGIGFRILPNLSVDFVYHHYEQVEAAPFIRDTRLRSTPTGLSDDIGDELDIIVGFKVRARWRVELDLAWFAPGEAFPRDDGAFFMTLATQFNF